MVKPARADSKFALGSGHSGASIILLLLHLVLHHDDFADSAVEQDSHTRCSRQCILTQEFGAGQGRQGEERSSQEAERQQGALQVAQTERGSKESALACLCSHRTPLDIVKVPNKCPGGDSLNTKKGELLVHSGIAYRRIY